MRGAGANHREAGAERSQLAFALGAILCAMAIVLFFVGSLVRGVSNTPPPEPNENALAAPIGEQPANSEGAQPPPHPTDLDTPSDAASSGADRGADTADLELSRSEPTRLVIPALDVDARVTTVGRTSDGKIETPAIDAAADAAWYRLGFAPGELGSAIIVGHVDTEHGPGVFYRLSTLDPNDVIEVERADGTVASFAVEATREYLKTEFPARDIFDPRGRAGLVLITCGGNFDRQSGYDSNVVVYAKLMSAQ